MGWRFGILVIGLVHFLPSGFSSAAEIQPPIHDLALISSEMPPVLESGEVFNVAVVVANNGSSPWKPEEGFSLSYHWFDSAGVIVEWEGRRTQFPNVVEPGASAKLIATVEAPRRSGEYSLIWDLVHENVMWISEADPTPVVPVVVSVRAGHAATIISGKAPRIAVAGSEVSAVIELRNEGSRRWYPGGSFALSYHWFDRSGEVVIWDGRRTPFRSEVGSGETTVVNAVLELPQGSGRYLLQWDVVEEGVCWFSERADVAPQSVTVLVIPDPVSDLRLWAFLSLLFAAVSVSFLVRGRPGRLGVMIAAGDLIWCVGSLTVKQGFLLSEAGVRATSTGWFLIIGGATALALITTFLPPRLRLWGCWFVVIIGTLVLWADLVYLRFFGDLPSPVALSAMSQLGRVEATIRGLLSSGDFWMWIDLLPGLVLLLSAGRVRQYFGARHRRVARLGQIAAAACVAGAALMFSLTAPVHMRQLFRRVSVAQELGVLNLHALDSGRLLFQRLRRSELEPDEYREVVAWFRDRAPQRAGVGPWFGAGAGANLVMLQVESLQGFVIGLEIDGQEVTPFLNRWTQEALWFSEVTDQTSQGRSSDSEMATQVSLLPMAGGAAAFRYHQNNFTGLAEILEKNGYNTMSAVPYEGTFWNRRVTHPAFGFSQSLFDKDFSPGEIIGWGLNDRDFLDQSAERLVEAESPFCAYLLTLSLHHPFEGFPEHLKTLDVGRWEDTTFGNFIHTMHFFDASLESFVRTLEDEGLLEKTVIAVWGDHDAGFEWRSEIASVMGASHDPAGWYLSQEVPLFIRVPGSERLRGEKSVIAGHADVAPTLLALLGIDPKPFAFIGRNLLGEPGDVPVVGEYGCWRNARYLFLQGGDSVQDGECYEVATMRALPQESCGVGFEAAQNTEEISSLVLEHDLQQRIHHELGGRTP